MDRRMLVCRTNRLNSMALIVWAGRKCDRMDTLMCQRTTAAGRIARTFAILLLGALAATAQTAADSPRPNWRRIGSSVMELALASPATGPVNRIWFSPDGSRLYALTASGRLFESADLESWSPAVNPAAPPPAGEASAVRQPETGVKLSANPRNPRSV